MGAKSFPSAPSPCSQMMLARGFFAVSISIASSVLLTARRSFLRPDGRLRAEGLHHVLAGLDVRPADQVDAIGDGGKDAGDDGLAVLVLQAFERLADRLGLAWQVDDDLA